MSYNFNPQPSVAATSSASMITPQAPAPSNVGGPYLATASKQYYNGAVRFAAGATMNDTLFFEPEINLPGSINGYFFASPLCKCGVISLWLQYAPSQQTNSGWPRIGQDGSTNMLPYFGTDPAHGTMGSIEVELVPISGLAVEFSPGAL